MTYFEFTAMKWYATTVTIARTPRVLAREYKVSWVIMVTVQSQHSVLKMKRHHRPLFVLSGNVGVDIKLVADADNGLGHGFHAVVRKNTALVRDLI